MARKRSDLSAAETRRYDLTRAMQTELLGIYANERGERPIGWVTHLNTIGALMNRRLVRHAEQDDSTYRYTGYRLTEEGRRVAEWYSKSRRRAA